MNNVATPRLQQFGRPGPNTAAAPPDGADLPDPHAWLADFLGGRVLAWLGGVATLLAIVLLLVLAISRGWLGQPERVGVAGAASALLMAAGMWLHARRGRTEAAVAMVGAATAGGFATLVAAGEIYRLIPALAAVAGSVLIGALATALAIRWAGRAIAAIGLVGALISPLLVGAYTLSVAGLMSGGATIAILGVATACAIGIVTWRHWPALGLVAMLITTPQWVLWLIAGHSGAVDLSVLTGFGLLGLGCAVGAQLRSSDSDVVATVAASLALVNAALVGIVAHVTLGPILTGIYLAGMGSVYVGVALWVWPRLPLRPTLRRLLVAIGVVAIDVALSLLIHGPFLSAALGVGAVGFSWLMRRSEAGTADGRWLAVAVGEHVALVLARALIALPPGQVSTGPQLESILSVGLLAVTCLICGRAAGPYRAMGRMALDVLGLGAIGYLTLATLEGAALVGAWTGEAIALAEVARRGATAHEEKAVGGARAGDPVAWPGGLVFLGAAAMYALALIARPNALVIGAPDLGQAALALGALTVGALRTGLVAPRGSWLRRGLLSTAALTLLYLTSVAVITVFQPAAASAPDTLLELGVRQQGQVLLSALWGLVGVGTLIAGLGRKRLWLRSAALALLLTTVAKVFLYDLSTLTSLYRVVSFFVLGALLLVGAFAYQRLRPPPPPDLRRLHPSQR